MKNLVNWIKENKLMFGVGLGVLVMTLAGILTFLFSKDNHEGAITGLQALKQQTAGFWIWAVIFTALAGVATHFVIKKVKSEGGYNVPLKVLIPIFVFIAIAWGKGCTDKANDGVTSGKGRPIPAQVDTLRQSAEDILKQAK